MSALRRVGLLLCALLALLPALALAQGFGFQAPASVDDPALPAVMRDLAERILPVYEERDAQRYLATVSALQLTVGEFRAAYDSRASLRKRAEAAGQPVDMSVVYDLYCQAKAIQARERKGFEPAYTKAFRDVVPRFSARELHAVAAWLALPQPQFRDALQGNLNRLQGKYTISFDEALELVWNYVAFDAYRSFGPLIEALVADEDRLRYTVHEDVRIRTASGARLHAYIVRPSRAPGPLPALLEFSIDESTGEAKVAAAHDYVGVVAYTRGKKTEHGQVQPFQYDGEDARAVIGWITQQPWSDGRVGMMGSGYSGFTAWAAATRLPAALKAIATYSPMAPGVDFPMRGNIFHNQAYRWAEAQAAPTARTDDDARWDAFNRAWYQSGRRYRDLEFFPGRPDRSIRDMVRNWLTHPSYDRFWQKRVPFGKQFASVNIPVLTMSGYYAPGEVGALYYLAQHLKHDPDAQHRFLIGPYDGRGAVPAAAGQVFDEAAQPDLQELRYQWFDYVLKGGPRPEVLKDRVNLQISGSADWRHAPSLAALDEQQLRFYLARSDGGERHRLAAVPMPDGRSIEQTVNFADRHDADPPPALEVITQQLPLRNALVFASEPLHQPLEVAGLFSGAFDLTLNRMDVDLNITVYEQLADGRYLRVADPYEFRASYLSDRTTRQLLQNGVRQQLPFTSERLIGHRFQPGSRVLLVLAVNKRPDQEINYGTGQDVSEESLDPVAGPLRIRWHGGSHVDFPVRK